MDAKLMLTIMGMFPVPFNKNLVNSACVAALWMVVRVELLAHVQAPQRMKRLSLNAQVPQVDFALKMSYLVIYVVQLVEYATIMVFGHPLSYE
jgi:hypothetical protein